MLKSSKISHIAIDKSTNLVYNTSMKSNNNNNNTNNSPFLKGTTMTNLTHDVRVIKHIGTSYDVFANFPTVQDALDYMRRMSFGIDTWYIVNADGVRLRMNQLGKLEVFHSLIG
jgi:hypothetical protein